MGSRYNDEMEELFRSNTQDILKFIGLGDAKVIRFQEIETKVTIDFTKESDFAVEILVEQDDEQYIVHFEFQTCYCSDVPEWLYDYNIALYLQARIKVHAVLFLLSNNGYKEESVQDYHIHSTLNGKGMRLDYELLFGWKGIAKFIQENPLVG